MTTRSRAMRMLQMSAQNAQTAMGDCGTPPHSRKLNHALLLVLDTSLITTDVLVSDSQTLEHGVVAPSRHSQCAEGALW